ncbi:MAG: hypothetical protein IPP66_15270 [Anaerolineales bacterium]|nr:hypothetical protein [Anaerolineales bacterium]
MTKMRAAFEYILDNLFDVVTVLIAGYIVIRHQVRPFLASDIAELATWILAVLGLIAVSGIWERNRRLTRIEKLSEESRDLVLRRLSGRARSSDFFISGKSISDSTFASAMNIFVSGMTLTRTTREYMEPWGQRLIAGANIRLMILDSSKEDLLGELVLRSAGTTNIEYWRNRLQTVETLVEIIAKTQGSKGKLELGRLPFIPSFGFTMIDPDEYHGICYVELYHHKSAKPNPTFELVASKDPDWYKFFREQYEILWDSCRIQSFENFLEPKKAKNG